MLPPEFQSRNKQPGDEENIDVYSFLRQGTMEALGNPRPPKAAEYQSGHGRRAEQRFCPEGIRCAA